MQTYTFTTPLFNGNDRHGDITVTVNYNFDLSGKYIDYDIYDLQYNRSLIELWEFVYETGKCIDEVIDDIVTSLVDEMTEREIELKEEFEAAKREQDKYYNQILNRQFINP